MSNWNERMLGAPSHSEDYGVMHDGHNRSMGRLSTQWLNRSAKIKICFVAVIIVLVIVIVVPIMMAQGGKHQDNPAKDFPTPVTIYSALSSPINQRNQQSILVLPDEYGIRADLTEVLQFYSTLGYNVYCIDYFFGGSINQTTGQSRDQFMQKYPFQQSVSYARQSIKQLDNLKYQSIQLLGYGYGANVALSIKQSQQDSIGDLVDSVIVAYPWILNSFGVATDDVSASLMDPLLKPTFFIAPKLSPWAANMSSYDMILTSNAVSTRMTNYSGQVDGFAINQSIDGSVQTNKTQVHADTLEWLLAHGRDSNGKTINHEMRKGTKSQTAGVPVYVVEPFIPSARSTVVLYLPDNKGDRFESERIVDFYGNIGFRTLLVDYVLTDANRAINQTYAVLNELRNGGTQNFIAVGFCYGGKVAVTLAQNSSAVLAAGTGHPSRLLATDAPLIEKPVYFAMSSMDSWTTNADGWPLFDTTLSHANIAHEGKVFQQRHGWTQDSPTTMAQLIDKYVAHTTMIAWMSSRI